VAPVEKALEKPVEKAAERPVTKPVGAATTRPIAGMWRWAVPAVTAAAIAVYVATRPDPATLPGGNGSATQPVDSAIAGAPTTPDTTRADSGAQGADSASPVVAGAADSVAPRADSTPAGPAVDAPVATRIDLRPARPGAITPGQTVALAATVRDAGGAPLRNARVSWESSDPRVATVDAARGTVRGIAPGAARITARAGDVTSRVNISVAPPAPDPSVVASIDLSGVSPLTVGETARATATARNASGAHLGSAGITWSSTNPDIATVASNGTITARAAGSTTIRATSGGQSADRVLTVRAREVTRADTPAAPPSNPGPPPTPRKTEAELRSEVQSVLETYVRAIQTRDTSLIRRVFPSVGNDVLRRWQSTFDDAPGGIRMTGATQIQDTPRDAAGAQVRAQVRYSASFHSRAARADQSFPVAFTATLVRGPDASWRIVSTR
jgi:hypothetical protein